MRYIKFFENYSKAESIIKKYKNDITKDKLDNIEKIKASVAAGYVGKLVEFYIVGKQFFDDIMWVCRNISRVKLKKQIDSYSFLSELIHDIKLAINIQYINKIKKDNSIKVDLDINFIADELIKLDVDLSKLDLPVFNKIENNEDFISIASGDALKNLRKHQDWDIIYEDDNFLLYEILSYEGAMHLIHKYQCIRHENMFNHYKKAGRLFNCIDKRNLNDSIFLDYNTKNNKYTIHRWDDKYLVDIDADTCEPIVGNAAFYGKYLEIVNLAIEKIISKL